jgi:integrase
MLATCRTDIRGVRDRALIAFGFASAMRRSELVALRVEDLTEVLDGYRVLIRRSKTDQTGRGRRSSSRGGCASGPWRRSRRGYRPPASGRGFCSGRCNAGAR